MTGLWPTDALSVAGDLCSIAGVGLTVFLTTTALQVRREFQRLILLPAAVERFTRECVDMTGTMPPGTPKPEMIKLLGVVEGTLKPLMRYLDKSERQSVNAVLTELRRYRGRPTEEAYSELYGQMWRLSTELEETIRRMQWNK